MFGISSSIRKRPLLAQSHSYGQYNCNRFFWWLSTESNVPSQNQQNNLENIFSKPSPKLQYLDQTNRNLLKYDQIQLQAVDSLDTLHESLKKRMSNPNIIEKCQGVYLYGGVGRGKTMLMDLFYSSLDDSYNKTGPKLIRSRVHYHSWMLSIHKRLHHHRGLIDPLANIALEIARDGANPDLYNSTPSSNLRNTSFSKQKSITVLCLDELEITDVADAFVTRALFEKLWNDHDVITVFTSNAAPEALYQGGINRSSFTPFIQNLEKACVVVNLDILATSTTTPPSTTSAAPSIIATAPSVPAVEATVATLERAVETRAEYVQRVALDYRTLASPVAEHPLYCSRKEDFESSWQSLVPWEALDDDIEKGTGSNTITPSPSVPPLAHSPRVPAPASGNYPGSTGNDIDKINSLSNMSTSEDWEAESGYERVSEREMKGVWDEDSDGSVSIARLRHRRMDPRAESLVIGQGSRTLQVPISCGDICRFRFEDLCGSGSARGAVDYLALAERYRAVALEGVPVLGGASGEDQTRRFITLIDVLYEHQMLLLVQADADPHDLFRYNDDDNDGGDEGGIVGLPGRNIHDSDVNEGGIQGKEGVTDVSDTSLFGGMDEMELQPSRISSVSVEDTDTDMDTDMEVDIHDDVIEHQSSDISLSFRRSGAGAGAGSGAVSGEGWWKGWEASHDGNDDEGVGFEAISLDNDDNEASQRRHLERRELAVDFGEEREQDDGMELDVSPTERRRMLLLHRSDGDGGEGEDIDWNDTATTISGAPTASIVTTIRKKAATAAEAIRIDTRKIETSSKLRRNPIEMTFTRRATNRTISRLLQMSGAEWLTQWKKQRKFRSG